jgi:hypothetical protein
MRTYLCCCEDINASAAGSLLQTLPLFHHNEWGHNPPKRITNAAILIAFDVKHRWHEVPERGATVYVYLLYEFPPVCEELYGKH